MRSRLPGGLGFRIALAAIVVALLAVGIVAVGTLVLGSQAFLDLMTADDTFVNDRLAKHYGIPDVFGSYFRRVHLADDARR